jgi:hypothetical protein
MPRSKIDWLMTNCWRIYVSGNIVDTTEILYDALHTHVFMHITGLNIKRLTIFIILDIINDEVGTTNNL